MAIKINVNFKTEDKGQVSQPVLKPVNPLWNKNVTPSPVTPIVTTPTSAPVVPRLQLPQVTTNRIQTMKESALEPQYAPKRLNLPTSDKLGFTGQRVTIPEIKKPLNYVSPLSDREKQIALGMVKPSEEERNALNIKLSSTPQSAIAQGVFKGASFGLSDLGKSKELRQAQEQAAIKNPNESIGGQILGSLLPQGIAYKLVDKAIKGTKIGSKLLGSANVGTKILASQVAQNMADVIIQTPIEVFNNIQSEKKFDQAVKDYAINRGIDVILNALMGGIEFTPEIKKALESNFASKRLTEIGVTPDVVEQIVKNNDQVAIQELKNKVNIKGNEYGVSQGVGTGTIQTAIKTPSLKVVDGQKVVRPEPRPIGPEKFKGKMYDEYASISDKDEREIAEMLGIKPTSKEYEDYSKKVKEFDSWLEKSIEKQEKRNKYVYEQRGGSYMKEPTPSTQITYKGFSTKTTGTGYDEFLDQTKLEYKKTNKGQTAYVAEMSPNEYNERVAKQVFKLPKEKSMSALRKNKVAKYINDINNGDEFPMPIIDYRKGSTTQEGRHRALAAELSGIDKIPVLIVEDIAQPMSKLYAQQPRPIVDTPIKRTLTPIPTTTKRLELPKLQKANMDQAKPEYTLSQEVPKGKLTKGFDDAVKVEDGAKLKERGMSKNVRTDVNRPDALRENFDADKLFHETLANKTTLESAQARFDRGYDEALKDFDMTKTDLRADNVPLAKLIADEATKRGDMYTARRVVTDIAESLTTAGQFSQAAKILRASNDPATILMFVEKEIKKLNDQGLKRYGAEGKNLFGGKKGWSKIELTDDELGMIKKFTEEGTDEGKEKLFQDLFDSVSKRIPTTAREKFDSFRRMAMLFNPKTHIRNIAGNGLMAGMKKIADTIAVGGEKFIKPELRTKSIVIPKELKSKADDYFKANSKQLLEGSRWEVFGVKSAFAEKPIFKTGWLETLNDVSKNTLEAEDVFFFKKHFTNDLAGFMNARGLKEPTQEAIDYATKRAQEATFREANELANAINKLKGTKYGLIVEAAIPFTKTPANILSSGVKYSPIGLVQGAIQLMVKAPPAQAIETLSKGLTGTGLVALGAYMASQGLARGKYEKGKAEGLSEASGMLPNSIQTPQGSYTIDWAQPSAIPFFMGVAMMEEAKKNKDASFVELMLKGLYAGGDTLVDQSMLKNVKELLGGGFGSAAEKITSLPIDYLKQTFPTVAGQVSRSIDPVKRERDYTNLATTTLTDLQSRTPILSSKLPPKRDILGEEVKYGKVGIANTINQFLNPGTVGTKTYDPVVKELSRLYETQGSDFLPRQSVSKFKDKISYELTNKEKSEFQRIMGSYTKDKVSNLINTNGYKLMSDEKKAKAIASINDEGYDLAKKEIIKQRGN